MTTKKYPVSLITAGILVAVLGVAGYLLLPHIFDALLRYRLPLEPGSESYEGWKKIPFPIYQKFYYFNVTNPEGFLHHNEKPILQQVGPYTWRSEWVKEDVEWYANGTVQYRERKRYWFDRQHSVGDQDDIITTINTPLVAASQKVEHATPLVKLMVAVFLNAANETIFIQRSIRQLTYEGYPDVLAQLSHLIDPRIPVKNGRFAYMSGRNDTDDGLYVVFTGKDDIRKFNEIEKWNGKDKLPWWDANSTCSEIKGTNGELVHPVGPKDTHLYFFNPVFCRPWSLQRTETVDSFGLSLQRFIAGADVLYNSTLKPEYKCFDTAMKLPSGAMDLSPCRFGVPLVLSYPHFYAADPFYLNTVSGLNPQKDLHEFHFDIEPRIGIALGLKARAQINVKLARVPFLNRFRDIPEIVLPVFWQEIEINQTAEFAQNLRWLLDRPQLIAKSSFLSLVVSGLLVSIGMPLYVFLSNRSTEKDRRSLLANEEGADGYQNEDEEDDEVSPSASSNSPEHQASSQTISTDGAEQQESAARDHTV